MVLEVNEIATLFPKRARGIVNWVNKGMIANVDKEKALLWLGALRTHPGTELTKEELYSAAKIINHFVNPKISTKNFMENQKRNISQSKVEDFRQELINANIQLRKEHPELLKDFTRKTMFDTLLHIETGDGLKQWLKAIQKTAIPTEGAILSGGNYHENTLANVVKKTASLSEGELALAAGELAKLVKSDFKTSLDDSIKTLENKREVIERDSPSTIALFKSGNGYIAFGNDADRIFEEKGWQTTEVATETRRISWMPINEDGMNVLRQERPSLVITDANAEIRDFKKGNGYAEDKLISEAQQTLDYMRGINTHDYVSMPTQGLSYYTQERNLYEVEHKINSIVLDKGNVELVGENGKAVPLMSNGSWNVNGNTKDALLSLSSYLQEEAATMKEGIWQYDKNKAEQITLADTVIKDYNKEKAETPGILLAHRTKGEYFAYGNDAVAIAKELRLPLWQVETSGHKNVPVAVFPADGYGMDALDLAGKDVRLFKSSVEYNKGQIGLELSPLNEGLNSTIKFRDASVFKLRSGDYAVRASVDGVQLESKTIPTKDALRYASLPNGEEKDITLKTMLARAYKEEYAKGMKVAERSAGMKF